MGDSSISRTSASREVRAGRNFKKTGFSGKREARMSAKQLARKALREARKNKVNNQGEGKFIDTTASTAVSWTQAATILNIPAQGQTDSTRVGDHIKTKKITIRGHAIGNASATLTSIRIIVFVDKASDQSGLLENNDTVYTPFNSKTHDGRFKTKVLIDEMITLDNTHNAEGFQFHVPIPEKYQNCQFLAASTTPIQNSVKILLVSNEQTNTPTVTWYARCNFTDV